MPTLSGIPTIDPTLLAIGAGLETFKLIGGARRQAKAKRAHRKLDRIAAKRLYENQQEALGQEASQAASSGRAGSSWVKSDINKINRSSQDQLASMAAQRRLRSSEQQKPWETAITGGLPGIAKDAYRY